MADMAQDNFSGNCTVVDSPKVIWSLVWGVLFLGFGLFLLYASIKQGTHNGITYFLVALGVLNLIRFRVNRMTATNPVAVSKPKTGQRTFQPLALVPRPHEALRTAF